jgi:hypothetical protein
LPLLVGRGGEEERRGGVVCARRRLSWSAVVTRGRCAAKDTLLHRVGCGPWLLFLRCGSVAPLHLVGRGGLKKEVSCAAASLWWRRGPGAFLRQLSTARSIVPPDPMTVGSRSPSCFAPTRRSPADLGPGG